MRSLTAVLILQLLFVFGNIHAFSLWPFSGGVDKEKSSTEQTELARPYYDRAVAADDKGSERTALRNYKKIYEDYPAADFAAQALFRYGEIQFENNNWKKSFESFQRVLIFHPNFDRFNEVIEYQFQIAINLAEGKNVRFLFVIPYKALNQATLYFEYVVANAPYSRYAPLALMNVALIYQHEGQTAQAIDALDRLINNYPSSLLASEAYLNLAETFASIVQGPEYDQGATREAMSYFEDFLILFSESENVRIAEEGLADMEDVYSRSKLVIGEYYFKYRGWFDAANIFFNEAITVAPNSPSAARARELIAEIERIRREYAENAGNNPRPTSAEEKNFIKRFWGKLFS